MIRLMSILSRPSRVVLQCLVSGLAGCAAVGPDWQAPKESAPVEWSEWHGGASELAAASPVAAQWAGDPWSLFADADLIRLQQRSRDTNGDVRTALLRVRQARIDETRVSAQRGMQGSARAAASRQQLSENGSSTRLVSALAGADSGPLVKKLGDPYDVFQAGFDASWEPDLWGRVLRSEEAARATTAGDEAALRQAQLTVSAEVARQYLLLRAAQRQQRLVQRALVVAQDAKGLLTAQGDHGLTNRLEDARQQTQIDALQAALPPLLAQEAQALNQLTLLCDARPGSLNAELSAPTADASSSVGDRREDTPLPDLKLGLPADLARRRPDIASAEARLQAATANVGVAVADLYPRITLGASFGIESLKANRLDDWSSRQWSIGPSLSLPVFDHGRRRATVTLRELQQQEAAVAFQQAVLRAWHDVDDAISAYNAERLRQQWLLERLQSSVDERELARVRQASGLTSDLPVLSAEASTVDARRELADSSTRVHIALVAVIKSLGG